MIEIDIESTLCNWYWEHRDEFGENNFGKWVCVFYDSSKMKEPMMRLFDTEEMADEFYKGIRSSTCICILTPHARSNGEEEDMIAVSVAKNNSKSKVTWL